MNLAPSPSVKTPLLTLITAAAMAACGGGGASGLQPPAPEGPTKLTADNMLDAAAVANVGDTQSYFDFAILMQSMDTLRSQLSATGSRACDGGGSMQLDRQGDLWRFTPQNCKTIFSTLASGSIVIDDSKRSTLGSTVILKDLVQLKLYADAPVLSFNAQYQTDIPYSGSEGQVLTGMMSVTNSGATRSYKNISFAQRAADTGYMRRDLSIQSPRFAHELKVTAIEAAQASGRSFVVAADDGSTITVSDLGASKQIELRSAKSVTPLAVRTVSAAEMAAARSRARQ